MSETIEGPRTMRCGECDADVTAPTATGFMALGAGGVPVKRIENGASIYGWVMPHNCPVQPEAA